MAEGWKSKKNVRNVEIQRVGKSDAFDRFKQYMAAKGYCTNVPFSYHPHLAHGRSAILKPQLAAELPENLRTNRDLFGLWWRN